MMRVGVLWERTTPEHLTSETESGLLGIPTPRVTNHQKNSGDKYVNLGAWVKMWPTPDAQAMNLNADPVKHMERLARLKEKHNNGNGAGLTLGVAVKMWPTPTAQDAKNNGAPSQMERNTKPLNAEVGGSLNPTWVEWLMGWPLGWTSTEPMPQETWSAWQRAFQTGWTDCAASAMAKFQPWCHSHGISCPPNPLRTEN
jgi:hypothetical protein